MVLQRGCRSLAAPSEVAQGGLGRGKAAVPVPTCHWTLLSSSLLPNPLFFCPPSSPYLLPAQCTLGT